MRSAIRREQSFIVAFAILTLLAWQTAIGTLLLMPFTLLATWFHEMAHGVAAMIVGAKFDHLVLFANGSGYAQYSGNIGTLDQALVAAAGLLGPAIAGSLMIIASRSQKATRIALFSLGMLLALSTIIWVRSLVGWIVLPLLAVALFFVATKANPTWQRITAEFLGVQGALSLYQDLGYIFTDNANVDGQRVISDTGAIADVLVLPYWFWGALITLTILAMVWKALQISARS